MPLRLLLTAALLASLLFPFKREAPSILKLYGHIELREADLAFNVQGRISEMRFFEGERVEEGELLARLEEEPYRSEVERLRHEVEQQRALLEELERGSRPQEIRLARAELEAARAEERAARLTYQRLSRLLPRKLVPSEEVDRAKAQAEAATSRRRALEERLKLVLEGPRRERIEAARAKLKALQAALRGAEKRYRDTFLYAPASGVIRERLLEPGEIASPSRPVYRLALLDPLWARVYATARQLGKLRLGMFAEVVTDTFPNKRYPGWIGYISPTAEFTPRMVQVEEVRPDLVYQVRVYVCDPSGELKLGMPVTVLVPLDQGEREIPCRAHPGGQIP